MPSEITTAAELAGYPLGTAAHLRVVRGSTTEFPLAQRVRGGWQTGVHHYPDEQVACVLEIYRPDRPAQPTVQPSVGEIADCIAAHPCDRDGDGHTRDDCPQARAVLALIGGRTEADVLRQASADLLSEMSHFPLQGRHTRAVWAADRLLTYADRQEARHG